MFIFILVTTITYNSKPNSLLMPGSVSSLPTSYPLQDGTCHTPMQGVPYHHQHPPMHFYPVGSTKAYELPRGVEAIPTPRKISENEAGNSNEKVISHLPSRVPLVVTSPSTHGLQSPGFIENPSHERYRQRSFK